MAKSDKKEEYKGFEQGPIRPPSEAHSLLIRVSRNCPWNKCAFCPVYKRERFSLRPVAHVKKDIDAVARHVHALREMADSAGQISKSDIDAYMAEISGSDRQAFHAALNWFAAGMSSVFLQDANSLIIKPADMVDILTHIKAHFPWVARITSYARSHTIARISDGELKEIAAAGLNRIHIGMESASDEVLTLVAKGTTKEQHVKAGKKVVNAGMELSEYVMPGLGGRALSRAHATETADALNQINPHFIRLRTLAIPGSVPLYEEFRTGRFEKLTDYEVAEEILLFLETLDGITSYVKSDHILNLFEEVEGKLPEDRERMTRVIRTFLEMTPPDRMRYQVGRRLGYFRRLEDAADPKAIAEIDKISKSYAITPENVDQFIDTMMTRYI
ncbi:MAG: radical SAM protein [Desulfosalsimonadaceae bacterium]